MTRIILLTAVLAATQLTSPTKAQASEGPWCAIINLGPSAAYEDCQYWSFERCRQNVLAGNRGFCNPNPRFVANQPGYSGKGKRNVQSY